MRVIRSAKQMRVISEEHRYQGQTVGFVPTMGALHEGHLSLVQAARKENDVVITSIFVNPTQFGPGEDLEIYPRDFEGDKAKLTDAGCDYLFYPSVNEMYPSGDLTVVEVKQLTDHLCGPKRPGHFIGVATVVAKLFNITLPHRAYFGQKDYQQSVIIQRMVKDLHFAIEIRVMPIVRDADGLALSSRNSYLDSQQRQDATVLYKALKLGESKITEGWNDAPALIEEIKAYIRNEVPSAKIDYVAIVNPNSLEDVSVIEDKILIALAIYIGKTRLIDNLIVQK